MLRKTRNINGLCGSSESGLTLSEGSLTILRDARKTHPVRLGIKTMIITVRERQKRSTVSTHSTLKELDITYLDKVKILSPTVIFKV